MNRLNALARSGTTWFVIIVFVVLAVGGALSAVFWTDLVGTGDNKDSPSTTVRNVMLMIGAPLALLLAIWRGWVAERQVKATQQSVDAAHEAIANQRFQAAAQMLGHEVSSVRLGAVHTLDELARNHPERYYIQSSRLLAAFIRNPSNQDPATETKIRRGDGESVREDVNAALNFIGSRTAAEMRLEQRESYRIDLNGAPLTGLDLRALNLSRVMLRSARLSNAHLEKTDLTDADLSSANLSGAHMEGAILRNTKLARANFRTRSSRIRVENDASTLEGELRPTVGLVQSQLDEALDDRKQGPLLRGVKDSETDEQLLWHGRQPDPS